MIYNSSYTNILLRIFLSMVRRTEVQMPISLKPFEVLFWSLPPVYHLEASRATEWYFLYHSSVLKVFAVFILAGFMHGPVQGEPETS